MQGSLHCDYLNLTIPENRSRDVRSDLIDHLSLLGAVPDTADLYRLNGGTLKITDRKGFSCVGLSGGLLRALRENSMLSPVLHTIGCGPHRLTRVDVAYDVFRAAPPVLQAMHDRAKRGGIALTRKRISPKRVKFIESYDHIRPGRRTGSLYLGTRSSEVRALIYDKRCERIDKGFTDPGPWVRYELTVTGKLSPSLRDVVSPKSMYWHFMSDVLPPPSNVEPWEGLGESYRLEPPPELLPHEIMARKVESSPDVEQLLELAQRMGPNGYTALLRMLDKKRTRIVQPTDSIAAA